VALEGPGLTGDRVDVRTHRRSFCLGGSGFGGSSRVWVTSVGSGGLARVSDSGSPGASVRRARRRRMRRSTRRATDETVDEAGDR
jgi:hypothetical protein